MGKCKKRTLNKNSSYYMTREDAVSSVFNILSSDTGKYNMKSAVETISLFGISAEELSEAGLPYENLVALGSAIS
ncbi:hypothetical protein IJ670_07550 [bacterium]|nr:hypothetical protein [bacterium]